MPDRTRKRPQRRLRIAIVGGGKVGSVLGRILLEEGCAISAVVSRTPASARRAGRFLNCTNTGTSLDAIPADTDLLFITTPHSAVESVARALAAQPALRFPRLAACHASGMLTAVALLPLENRGTTVFSFHPLQTFPRDFPPAKISARGITYGVDGSPEGVRYARRLARILGGSVLEVPPELRSFYHAACVVASNHLTTLLWVLERMFSHLGTGERDFIRVFRPIIHATLENIERTSPATAMSGPVARGGVETVAEHFDTVRAVAPELLPIFSALTRESVGLAIAKGSITEERAQELLACTFAAGGAETTKPEAR
ncbi:MAG: Rossmann-like and DUF2520 domain-containing protein [Bacteroidota bacterium]